MLAALLAINPVSMGLAMTTDEFAELERSIATMQEDGSLAAADATIRGTINAGIELTTGQRQILEREIERSRRIRMDYSLTPDGLLEALGERVKDFQVSDYEAWIADGRFDFKHIDDEMRFVGPSVSNLFKRYPELRARRLTLDTTEYQDFLAAHTKAVAEELGDSAAITAKPHDFRLTMTITLKPGNVPKGGIVKCWMPYPQQFESQSGVSLIESSPGPKWINPPTYPTRSLYFEQPSAGDEPTVFKATYSVSVNPRRVRIDEALVTQAEQEKFAGYEYFTAEQAPHVVFSERIRALVSEIVGAETNPARKARLIYDWVSANTVYSYAREYSTLRCIPEYVLENGYGDCGQIALLYITLCRAAGIPARWQSGWIIYPMEVNLHDWTEIYLHPYGWIPVDPDYGVQLTHEFSDLDDATRRTLVDFFFGGLDAYRLTVNREHGYPHYPAKADFRSDDVDFQRGELEHDGKNLYFDTFKYKMDVEYLTPGDKEASDKAEVATPKPLLAPGMVR